MVGGMPLKRDHSVGEKLLMQAAVLTCTGRHELIVENYRGVRVLTDRRIEVQTRTCLVIVEGEELEASYYTREEMRITGNICSIQYAER